MSFINNYQNKKLFFINLSLIFIPILEFFLKNSNELDFYIIKNLLKFQIIIILIFNFFNFIFMSSPSKNFKIFYFSVCFYISFKYYFIKTCFILISNIVVKYHYLFINYFLVFIYNLKKYIFFFSSLKIFFTIYL